MCVGHLSIKTEDSDLICELRNVLPQILAALEGE
jgi:hypothetical protein